LTDIAGIHPSRCEMAQRLAGEAMCSRYRTPSIAVSQPFEALSSASDASEFKKKAKCGRSSESLPTGLLCNQYSPECDDKSATRIRRPNSAQTNLFNEICFQTLL
jgi:hypothetical protein